MMLDKNWEDDQVEKINKLNLVEKAIYLVLSLSRQKDLGKEATDEKKGILETSNPDEEERHFKQIEEARADERAKCEKTLKDYDRIVKEYEEVCDKYIKRIADLEKRIMELENISQDWKDASEINQAEAWRLDKKVKDLEKQLEVVKETLEDRKKFENEQEKYIQAIKKQLAEKDKGKFDKPKTNEQILDWEQGCSDGHKEERQKVISLIDSKIAELEKKNKKWKQKKDCVGLLVSNNISIKALQDLKNKVKVIL